jgi:hypothetical protein
LLEKTTTTPRNRIPKYTQMLFKSGDISYPFSVHNLRRYFITKTVKGITVDEPIPFSRKIHKNVSTTLG